MRPALAYGLASLSGGVLGNVFNTFHVDLFLSVYMLSPAAFNICHIFYAIWNTLNDLLGGYLADYLSSSLERQRFKGKNILQKGQGKVLLIKYGGVLWVLCFLILWFGWQNEGVESPWIAVLHFVCSLCLFDGIYSFVAIAHGSVLSEITHTQSMRVAFHKTAAIFNLVGQTIISFLSFYFWDKQNLFPFRIFCLILSVCSLSGFWLAAQNLMITAPKRKDSGDMLGELVLEKGSAHYDGDADDESVQVEPKERQSGAISIRLFINDLRRHKNFWVFLGMNILQECQAIFTVQFLPIFLEQLLPDTISFAERPFGLPLNSVLPTCMTIITAVAAIYLHDYVEKNSAYNVYLFAFICKIVFAAICLLLGPTLWLPVILFLFINRVATSLPLGFFSLTMADLFDEYKFKKVDGQRRSAAKDREAGLYDGEHKIENVYSMYWGCHALFAKPLNSVGPMIGTYVLSQAGYNDASQQQHGEDNDSVKRACFYLVTLLPLSVSVIQLIIWQFYTLRGKYLFHVKKELKQQKESPTG